MLDFRTLLKILSKLYKTDEFDTKTVADGLATYFYQKIKDPKLLAKFLERVQPKLVSNDLRRLYMMGFLKRRKVPRECTNKKGKKFNCGFKYMYSINNQGWGYLRQLGESEQSNSLLSFPVEDFREILVGMAYGMGKLAMISALENDEVEKAFYLWKLYKDELSRRFSSPGFRRFTRKRELFEMDTNCWMKMIYLEMQILSLEKEIRARDVMIRELKRELEACIESKRMFGDRVRFGELLEGLRTSRSLIKYS